MTIKKEIHEQIVGALDGASFPITSPEDLFDALPEGPETTCKSGDLEIKAADAGKLLTTDDFPFQSAKDVADTIVRKAGL